MSKYQRLKEPKQIIKLKFNNSTIHHPIQGEHYKQRHRRRWKKAMEMREMVEQWCRYRGIQLKIIGGELAGWRWDFKCPDKFAQWRPFAGHLNLKTQLRSKCLYHLKVHDVVQLLEILERWYESTTDVLA